MTRTRKQTESYNGFAVPLVPGTELGLAMLIAEDGEGRNEPVAVVGAVQEAREVSETYNGFAVPLVPGTELGLAMLIAEDGECRNEPVAVVGAVQEAREVSESDLRGRKRRLKTGRDPGIGPYVYKLWPRGIDGDYRLATEIKA